MATSKLQDIKGLGVGAVELLEAVGIDSPAELAGNSAKELYEELTRANEHLGLLSRIPSEKVVAGWVEVAQGMSGSPEELSSAEKKDVPEPSGGMNGNQVIVDSVPIALAVKKEQIVKNKIAVGDVPIMENFLEDDELSYEAVREKKRSSQNKVVVNDRSIQKESPSKSIPLSGVDSFELGDDVKRKVEPLEKEQEFDIRRTASPELNEGRKLHSRRYVRGVLHPRPGQVKWGAIVSLITMMLIPISLASMVAVLFRKTFPFEVPLWAFTIAPALFLIFVILYLTMVRPLKCRVCGQPLLSSKKCFRHVKAHRFRLIGYIFPTSLHMLLFHWFRCIYCGTSVRLKK